MKLIVPQEVTDAVLTATNVSETSGETIWNSGTVYAEGARVILTSTHRAYESTRDANLNNNPATDDGSNWIDVEATNPWKAFDQRIANPTTNSGTITYTLSVASKVTALAFFQLNAPSVRVVVKDSGLPANTVFDQTVELVDASDIYDWFTFFTTELDTFKTEVLFTGFVAFPGYMIEITIGDGTGTPAVGEIAFGNLVTLGTSVNGTSIGLRSFSSKEQDQFGSFTIVPRAKSDPIEFHFSMAAQDSGRI